MKSKIVIDARSGLTEIIEKMTEEQRVMLFCYVSGLLGSEIVEMKQEKAASAQE